MQICPNRAILTEYMMNNRDNKIFNILKSLANSNDFTAGASMAACIVYGNDIVAFGVNENKSHPFQAKYAKNDLAVYLHAETSAIKNALKVLSTKDLSRSKIYILRIKRDGSVALAKPCEGCQRCIRTFGISKIAYTTDNGEFSYE